MLSRCSLLGCCGVLSYSSSDAFPQLSSGGLHNQAPAPKWSNKPMCAWGRLPHAIHARLQAARTTGASLTSTARLVSSV